jgi:hypothetical protein
VKPNITLLYAIIACANVACVHTLAYAYGSPCAGPCAEYEVASSDSAPIIHNHRRHREPRQWPVLTAREARDIINETDYKKHPEQIDWWIDFINAKVVAESKLPNACVRIDLSNVNWETQGYLAQVYEDAGYRSSLEPGWNKAENRPDSSHTTLALCW